MGNRDVEIDDRDLLRDDEELDEAAVSKAQKRFYCYVKLVKKVNIKIVVPELILLMLPRVLQ